MVIMVYIGVMGLGKFYEGISIVVFNVFCQGCCVVINIVGVNFEVIRDYFGLMKDGVFLDEDRVVVIQLKCIIEFYFFFDLEVEVDSVVKFGDLVLIDEVWVFWGKDCKLFVEYQKFFWMYWYYVELLFGVSSDLVVMIQDIISLYWFICGVVEIMFKFMKMKIFGLVSCYRVEVYEGSRQIRVMLVFVFVKKYDKWIFLLYKFYDGGFGKEKSVDDWQNLFWNKWFLLVMVVVVVGFGVGGVWFYCYVLNFQFGVIGKQFLVQVVVGFQLLF